MNANFDLSKIMLLDWSIPYTAAGTSTITSATARALSPNFDSVLGVGRFGTGAADNTVGIHGATSLAGSYSLMGSLVASSVTNVLCVVDLKQVGALDEVGWVKLVMARGTSSTIEGGLLIPYHSKSGAVAPATEWSPIGVYSLQASPDKA